MDAHVQTAKKGKSRQPSAFSLPGSGIQKYRFVLAGLLFILLPFLWAFIFLLPGNLLAFLRLPALPGGGSSFSPGLGTPVFILTGCWLLWKPRSARPAALAMAFTPLQKPVAFLCTHWIFPGFSRSVAVMRPGGSSIGGAIVETPRRACQTRQTAGNRRCLDRPLFSPYAGAVCPVAHRGNAGTCRTLLGTKAASSAVAGTSSRRLHPQTLAGGRLQPAL